MDVTQQETMQTLLLVPLAALVLVWPLILMAQLTLVASVAVLLVALYAVATIPYVLHVELDISFQLKAVHA